MAFDAGSTVITYRVDADDLLVALDPGWTTFAVRNGLPNLVPAAVLHRPIWDFVVDVSTRALYRLLLERVRDGRPVTFEFRCDSPEARRFMRMELAHTGEGSVQFASHLVRVEPRPPVRLLDVSARRSGDVLAICGWCKRVPVGAEWLEVEAAVERLGLADRSHLPLLSHGICPSCSQVISQQLDLPAHNGVSRAR